MINKSLCLTSKLPTRQKRRYSRPPHYHIIVSLLSLSHLHIYYFTVWQHLLYGTVAAKPRLSWPPGRETWCVAKCRPHSLKALYEVQLCQVLSHLVLTFFGHKKIVTKRRRRRWWWSRSAMWLVLSGLRFQKKQGHLVADRRTAI